MGHKSLFKKLEGFDWDEANRFKSWKKHKISYNECEEVFFNAPLRIIHDEKHSINEKRFLALGKTNRAKQLMISFTIRKNKLRVISARIQNKKERNEYEKY